MLRTLIAATLLGTVGSIALAHAVDAGVEAGGGGDAMALIASLAVQATVTDEAGGSSGPKPYTTKCERAPEGWRCYLQGDVPGSVTVLGIPNKFPNSAGVVFVSNAEVQAAIEALVRRAVAEVKLPEPTIKVGPDPSVNEWNMAVVGYPLWMWVGGGDRRSVSVTEDGIAIDISATRDRVAFNFGDGTSSTCTSMTPLPKSFTPGAPSPDCGHAYAKASLPKGSYTVTATAAWTFHWSALGLSGTLPGRVAATRPLRVGELQSVIVRNP